MTADLSIYLKSVMAGIVAMFCSAIVVMLAAFMAVIWISRHTQADTLIGFDFVSFARTPLAWTILLLAFVAGFYWQYRRAVAH
jgi:hypothetical protein